MSSPHSNGSEDEQAEGSSGHTQKTLQLSLQDKPGCPRQWALEGDENELFSGLRLFGLGILAMKLLLFCR